jgi:hypothetical protein
MNKKRPIPEVVDEKRDLHQRLRMNKKTPTGIGLFLFTSTSGIGLFLFIHNLWYRYLFIHPLPLS